MPDVSIGGLRVKEGGEQVIANYVWDTGSLAWIPQASSSGGVSGDVTVQNAVLYTKDQALRCVYDPVSTSTAYLGEAPVGASSASAVWRIRRIDLSPPVDIRFAGTGGFNQIWDDRTFLSY